MKTRFIRIRDISQLDLSKISVYDLGNRYIDAGGNMFGLRYNRADKKIEVIKIIRTPARGAGYYNQMMLRRRSAESSARQGSGDGGEDAVLEEGEEYGEVMGSADAPASMGAAGGDFNPDAFITETLQMMEGHKGRLNGIVMNVKNSNIVPVTDKMASTYLIDVFRSIDMDGVQRIDSVINNNKEFSSYPRSITYYLAKLDTRSKNIVDRLDNDSAKMRFIYLSEMFFAIRGLYRPLKQVFADLQGYLEQKEREEIARLSYYEEKYFQDAMTSIRNTVSEINAVLRGCKKLEDFIYNESRF